MVSNELIGVFDWDLERSLLLLNSRTLDECNCLIIDVDVDVDKLPKVGVIKDTVVRIIAIVCLFWLVASVSRIYLWFAFLSYRMLFNH